MKKFLVFAVALMCLMSCAKDEMGKTIYSETATIENTTYKLNVLQVNDNYEWSIVNSTNEVTYNYAFHYDSKKAIQHDFADVVAGLENIEDNILAALLPVFNVDFRFNDEIENEAIITRYVNGGTVFVNFAIGARNFNLPYSMVIAANEKLNPAE